MWGSLCAFGPLTRNWADTPIQNRQPRRCGGGLEHVSSRALACALPPVLQCCGMVQRQPGDGRRHDRGRKNDVSLTFWGRRAVMNYTVEHVYVYTTEFVEVSGDQETKYVTYS